MFDVENSLLLIIDIQDKLVAMLQGNSIAKRACNLANTARILNQDVIVTEQYPKGLGATISPLREALGENARYYEKTSFSALREEEIFDAIKASGKKHIIICGIEAHICVYQTAMELLEAGYKVSFVADASASRKENEYKVGVELMRQKGVEITCTEIVLFELLKSSKHPNFKEIQALIK